MLTTICVSVCSVVKTRYRGEDDREAAEEETRMCPAQRTGRGSAHATVARKWDPTPQGKKNWWKKSHHSPFSRLWKWDSVSFVVANERGDEICRLSSASTTEGQLTFWFRRRRRPSLSSRRRRRFIEGWRAFTAVLSPFWLSGKSPQTTSMV